MFYQIIARKYRPKNFSEVIGQGKIVTILQNALKKNRIGQAYLFSGPRGVGKTTTARILVKYLNCESEEKIIPCNECSSCDEINRGVSLDYLEIDGASNRGIDQIRALNEQLAFASPTGKYRVFVIDEVHMLTHEAFNALLKSLEEPPVKIIFILCTTESYRIPLTIRSRCQQLFFTNVDFHLIEAHLEAILKKEKIPFVSGSLWGLARKSEGSIRDAENLLEKIIAFNNEKEITSTLVQEILGETPTDKKYRFLHQLSEENLKANRELINQINAAGYSLNEFFYHLLDILSLLVYYKSGVREPEVLDLNEGELKQLKTCEKIFTLNEIFTLSDILFEFIRTLKNTTHQSTMVQYLLIKLHRFRNLITPREIKENILKLSRYTLPDPSLDIPTGYSSKTDESLDEPIPLPIHPTSRKTELSNLEEESHKIPEESKNQNQLVSNPRISSPNNSYKNQPSQNSISPSLSNTETKVSFRSSSHQKNLNKEYETFLEKLKEKDFDFFRIAAAFPFLGWNENSLTLENRNNLSFERLNDFKQKLENYLNQPTTQKPFQSSSSEPIKVVIQESIVKSNLEKIKKIFPLEE